MTPIDDFEYVDERYRDFGPFPPSSAPSHVRWFHGSEAQGAALMMSAMTTTHTTRRVALLSMLVAAAGLLAGSPGRADGGDLLAGRGERTIPGRG